MKKYTAYVYSTICIAIALFVVLPQIVFADIHNNISVSDNGSNSHTSVSVSNSTGNNTVCQNGNCTTTQGGSGQTSYCYNGNCTTTNGTVNYTSGNGDTHINVTNNNASVSQNPTSYLSQSPTDSPVISPVIATGSPVPHPSPVISPVHNPSTQSHQNWIQMVQGKLATLIKKLFHLW